MLSLTINAQNLATVEWDDEYFKYCEFLGFSFEGGIVSSDFAVCTFKNLDWYWGLFNMVNFVDCTFLNCVFQGTIFSDCKFIQCSLQNCHFVQDNLGGDCSFEGSVAYDCDVDDDRGFAAALR